MSIFAVKSNNGNQEEETTASKAIRFVRKAFKKEATNPEEHILEVPKQFFQFKVVLLGESGVGKSCLGIRFTRDFFNEYEDSTVGAAFMSKTLEFPKFIAKLDIWDTAGAEQFHILTPLYYKKAQAAIIVYDVTSRRSFENIKFWIKELRMANAITIIALVGNKQDMDMQRVVEYEEGYLHAKSNEFLFFETSAKTGCGVEQLFEAITKKLTKPDVLEDDSESKTSDIKDDCCCCKWF